MLTFSVQQHSLHLCYIYEKRQILLSGREKCTSRGKIYIHYDAVYNVAYVVYSRYVHWFITDLQNRSSLVRDFTTNDVFYLLHLLKSGSSFFHYLSWRTTS